MARTTQIEFTAGQLRALASAMDYFLNASTYEEAEQVFGSSSGVAAAARANDKISAAGNRIGAWRDA